MLIIESEETPQNKSGNLKEDAVFLLNDEEQSYNDQQIEKNKVDGGNKKTVMECKKWLILIKEVIDRNITVLSKI